LANTLDETHFKSIIKFGEFDDANETLDDCFGSLAAERLAAVQWSALGRKPPLGLP
jgi:hypothetical protein